MQKNLSGKPLQLDIALQQKAAHIPGNSIHGSIEVSSTPQ
jgi:hypothetical protein